MMWSVFVVFFWCVNFPTWRRNIFMQNDTEVCCCIETCLVSLLFSCVRKYHYYLLIVMICKNRIKLFKNKFLSGFLFEINRKQFVALCWGRPPPENFKNFKHPKAFLYFCNRMKVSLVTSFIFLTKKLGSSIQCFFKAV